MISTFRHTLFLFAFVFCFVCSSLGQTVTNLTVSPNPISGGHTAVGTVTLSAAAGSSGLTLALSSSETSVATVPATVKVAAGAKSCTFTLTALSVASDSKTAVTAKDPSGHSVLEVVTVDIPAVRITTISVSPSTIIAANAATGTVKLSAVAPTGGFVVNLTSSQKVMNLPASVTVQAGRATETFMVSTLPISADTHTTLTATDSSDYHAMCNVVVDVPAVRLIGLSISPNSVSAGTSATGTVTLSSKAPTGGFAVDLSTMESFVSVPMTVEVAAGATTATFTITTTEVSGKSTAEIEAKDGNGYRQTSSLAVTAASYVIQMTNVEQYSPKTITVPAGTTVTWTNVSFMSHTITSDVKSQGIAGFAAPNASYSWKVPSNAAHGTAYYYHCQYHGSAGNGKSFGNGMAGVVFVK